MLKHLPVLPTLFRSYIVKRFYLINIIFFAWLQLFTVRR
jgi:hypothetical protein